jgi:hypothetical protein
VDDVGCAVLQLQTFAPFGHGRPPRAAWLCGMSYVAAMTDYWMVFTGERDDAVVLGDTAPTDSARSSLPVTGTVGL